MVDTVRTKAQLQTLFADNVTGAITAQDGRDVIVATFGAFGSGPPGATNDNADTDGAGAYFDTGSRWIDQTNGALWLCLSGAPSAAVWAKVYPPAATGPDIGKEKAFELLIDCITRLSDMKPGRIKAALQQAVAAGNLILNHKGDGPRWEWESFLQEQNS